MNNYPNEQPEARKVVNNAAGLNTFLTKMYGWMSLAVLVSAATAFWLVVLLPVEWLFTLQLIEVLCGDQ